MSKRSSAHALAFLTLAFSLWTAALPAAEGNRSVTIIEGAPEHIPNASQGAQPPTPPTPLETDNPSGVTVEVLPGTLLKVGTDVAFRIGTQKAGYLLLVDINAEGTLTQIYPNVMSLTHASDKGGTANLIKPGNPVTVPDLKNPLARFTFRAEAPLGKGVIVAILSDRPVQLIDLPEIPASITKHQAVVDFLDNTIQGLKIADANDPGAFTPSTWSFSATEYVIR